MRWGELKDDGKALNGGGEAFNGNWKVFHGAERVFNPLNADLLEPPSPPPLNSWRGGFK